jgi:hypothetical protein
MKIQTNAGETDMDFEDPENVRKGMSPAGTIEIGAGLQSMTLACRGLVVLDTPPNRRASAEIVIEHRDEALLARAMDWLREAAPCEVRGSGVTFRACPMRWKSELLDQRAHRILVDLEEIAGAATWEGTIDTRASIGFGLAPAGASLFEDGTFSCHCGARHPEAHTSECKHWMRMLADGRSQADKHDVEFFAGEMALSAAEVRVGLLATAAGIGAVALLTWVCGMTPGARRPAQEAPLVALVAAVPAGLDPAGWRAAVLAANESFAPLRGDIEHAEEWGEKLARGLASALSGGDEDAVVQATKARPGSWTAVAVLKGCRAYARAIAPRGPRPAPFRRRAPGLPLDIDADLAGLDARAER